MIAEQGSEWYREICRSLEPCRCYTCECGTRAKVERITGSEPVCKLCDGARQVEGPDGEIRTCSGCLGGG